MHVHDPQTPTGRKASVALVFLWALVLYWRRTRRRRCSCATLIYFISRK